MASVQEGYSDERFQETVNEDLHCPICMNVLREPVHCGPNEHYFCKSCITTHLNTSKTCPCCQEKLSLDTVQPPPKFVTNRLNLLTISCDNANRGCEELVRLETLNDHVKNCGFSPVQCNNEGCSSVVNKNDFEHHVKKECEFREQCPDCLELKKVLEEVKAGLTKQLGEVKTDIHESIKEELSKVGNEPEQSTEQQDFIIIGGLDVNAHPLMSVIMFRWSSMSWQQLRPLRKARFEASAFAYNDQVIIAGGSVPSNRTGIGRTNRMEKISPCSQTAEWSGHGITLPATKSGHKCLVHKDHMLLIGGEDDNNDEYANAIHAIRLNPPYSPRVKAWMSYSLYDFGAEIFGDRVVIVGGSMENAHSRISCLSDVMEYNVRTNVFRQLPPLPFPVSHMTTVPWQDKLVVLGGIGRYEVTLDTVILYDVGSGQSTMLPRMLENRHAASAIVTGHVIVIMGGENETGKLSSVECFDFLTNTWKTLPSLDQPRSYASAVVKP